MALRDPMHNAGDSMIANNTFARRNWFSVLAVGVAVWVALTAGWQLIVRLAQLEFASSVWRDHFTASSPIVLLVVCCIFVVAIAAVQDTRNISSLAAAAGIGLLMAVIALPGVLASASSAGLWHLAVLRCAFVAAVMLGASMLLYLLRTT
jgi:hypothetical protein